MCSSSSQEDNTYHKNENVEGEAALALGSTRSRNSITRGGRLPRPPLSGSRTTGPSHRIREQVFAETLSKNQPILVPSNHSASKSESETKTSPSKTKERPWPEGHGTEIPIEREAGADTETGAGAGADTGTKTKTKTGTILYGFDISWLNPSAQFKLLVGTIFGFHAVYGYLQELISIHIAGRKFTLFISVIQLFGYAFWSWVLDRIRRWNLSRARTRSRETPSSSSSCHDLDNGVKQEEHERARIRKRIPASASSTSISLLGIDNANGDEINDRGGSTSSSSGGQIFSRRGQKNEGFVERNMDDFHLDSKHSRCVVKENEEMFKKADRDPPFSIFILLSFLRLVEVVMTNAATIYINFPMKTIMKSSKVAFTMLGGMTIGKKMYRRRDFIAVIMLIFGLGVFINADMRSTSVLFRPTGVAMLLLSLVADGAFVNFAELFMKKYNLSQDEFLLTVDSVSCVAMLGFAFGMGELVTGFTLFFLRDGSIQEMDISDESMIAPATATATAMELHEHGYHKDIWTIRNKTIILILFTLTGLLGTSSANAMVKYFGALNMSIVTTSRKAFTLFLSFLAFESNHCATDHLIGMVVFLSGLFVKSTNGAGNQIFAPCPDFSYGQGYVSKEKIDHGNNDDDDDDDDIATSIHRQNVLKRRGCTPYDA